MKPASPSKIDFKDHFSSQAELYSRYRPIYPPEPFAKVSDSVAPRNTVWDVGTGNGQAAWGWVPHFKKVIATDASSSQIAFAKTHPKIEYRICSAENANFIADGSINLISVAQAMHWFNFDRFYAEVARVAAKNAVIAIWCYGLFRITKEVDEVIQYYHDLVVGQYWEKERRFVDEAYRSIPFPFSAIDIAPVEMKANLSLSDLFGYLQTWSATQKAVQIMKLSPIIEIENKLRLAWGNEQTRLAKYPFTIKLGRVGNGVCN